ncbi:IS4 family transposase [Litorilituus sediminis]|uniref:IS4 family transposase n=1 Tax=Litorilituus sediminis TaxID=718192 RepID=A0A4P6P2Y5_9GAMM|nr:IS4 family transposase [Litorilituus sediminis]QBG35623.1 IS4 family transposase [Litorilituus sediminis]QBG36310.1 IS4 family transposase [Litorilituus sediminis]QBG37376.1 IS4 family transposase [Litorilituus sediminis]QBG37432.1 IS4 family transposase [Litorilituus sediminis]
MLSNWLLDTDTFAAPEDLSVFQKHLPMEWIEKVLVETDKASMRRRKLPAELVVWLIVGIGLYRNRPITEVVDKLDLILSDKLGETLAPSAIPQARKRLSDTPLAELFKLTATHWSQQQDGDDTWCGLSLFSVDGTQLRCADTPETASEFGYIKHRQDKHLEYPVVRLCALMSLRSRLIKDVAFGSSRVGEVNYAKQLISSASANSLTIFDRCYLSAELMMNWQRHNQEQHWLTPIKSNTKYRVIEQYSEHDFLIEMSVSNHARKQDPSLPEVWQARLVTYPENKQSNHIKGLLSSLTDINKYKAEDILAVYFERWEIENGYGELKQFQLDNAILLRSQTVQGVKQEIWGLLIAYNLIRAEISQIATEAQVSPLRISFVMAMRFIQDEFMWCAIASPGSIPKKLRAMRENVKQFILPEKRKRPKARTVRISKTRYPVKSKHA